MNDFFILYKYLTFSDLLHSYAATCRKLKTFSSSLDGACPLFLMLILLIPLAVYTLFLTLEGVVLKNLRLGKDNHKLYLKKLNYCTLCT